MGRGNKKRQEDFSKVNNTVSRKSKKDKKSGHVKRLQSPPTSMKKSAIPGKNYGQAKEQEDENRGKQSNQKDSREKSCITYLNPDKVQIISNNQGDSPVEMIIESSDANVKSSQLGHTSTMPDNVQTDKQGENDEVLDTSNVEGKVSKAKKKAKKAKRSSKEWNISGGASSYESSIRDEPEIDTRVLDVKPDSVKLFLKWNETIFLHGKAYIEVVKGCVDVGGFKMNLDSEKVPVYSPSSNSLVPITNINAEKMSEEQSVDNDVILQLSTLTNENVDYAVKMSPYDKVFPSVVKYENSKNSLYLRHLNVELFFKSTAYACMDITENYLNAVEEVSSNLPDDRRLTVVLCGGKDVGKSSFGRYLVNRMLYEHDEVMFLECDPGQCEFTPSGCVSLSHITQPLLGPPFTHQSWPKVVQYFGSLSPSYNANWYMKCVKNVYDCINDIPKNIPLVVNTMGWNKGLGLNLFIDTVKMVHADYIIQLMHSNRSRNFPLMDQEYLKDSEGWIQRGNVAFESKHKLIVLDSHTCKSQSNERKPSLHPKDHRNLMLLSYIGLCLQGDVYQIGWENVAISIAHCTVSDSQIFYAINASIVALCALDGDSLYNPSTTENDLPVIMKNPPLAHCLGFAVVRAIDPIEKVITIQTPIPFEMLKRINCLVKGALEIPSNIIMKQLSAGGEVPYVGTTQDTLGSSAVTRRRHMTRTPRKLDQSTSLT